MRAMLAEDRAQATVEMAVVTPVMIVLALIVYNVMVFASASARFDRVAPDIVLAHGVSAGGDGGAPGEAGDPTAAIKRELTGAMEGYEVSIEVEAADGDAADAGKGDGEPAGERAGDAAPGATGGAGGLLSMVGALRTYRCILRYEPWPRIGSIAGVAFGAPPRLTHERLVTVDPWRPGVVM